MVAKVLHDCELAVSLSSPASAVVIPKLGFLVKLLKSEHLISCIFQTLSNDNVYNIGVVKQCIWLL